MKKREERKKKEREERAKSEKVEKEEEGKYRKEDKKKKKEEEARRRCKKVDKGVRETNMLEEGTSSPIAETKFDKLTKNDQEKTKKKK